METGAIESTALVLHPVVEVPELGAPVLGSQDAARQSRRMPRDHRPNMRSLMKATCEVVAETA
jgi:hypothetical protein